jgi:hypothetical protein
MPRHCPRCASALRPSLIMLPKFMLQHRCPSCGAQLKFTRLFSWGLAIAYLLVSYAIYRLIDGNFTEALLIMPIAATFMAVEYHVAEIKIVEP